MQISTIRFFRFEGPRNQFWALKMMQLAHAHLREVPGQAFYKLMGSGRGIGFNPWPDWSTYCLFQVWEDENAATAFYEQAPIVAQYEAHSAEQWTLYMRTIKAHGSWSGGNPFQVSPDLDPANKRVAVLTRATIRWSKMIPFWRYVPTSQKPLYNMPGLLFQKGIGEAPIVQMATFSLWDNLDAVKEFAYRSEEHKRAIRMTRELDWYSEELFSRFQPYRSEGTWKGEELVAFES